MSYLERLELRSSIENKTEKERSAHIVIIRHGDVRTYGDPYSNLSLKGVKSVKDLAFSWANVFATFVDIKFDIDIRFSPRLRTTQSAFLFDYYLFKAIRKLRVTNVSASAEPLVDERLSPDGTVSVMGTYRIWALSSPEDILEKNGKTPEALKEDILQIFDEIYDSSKKLPENIKKVAFLWTHETSFRALWSDKIDFAYTECRELMWTDKKTC